MTENRTLSPTAGGERFEAIDVVRGFALFGVLLANLVWWTQDSPLTDAQRDALPTACIDAVVRGAVYFAVDGKFYTLFSFLFGLGFAVYLERGEARGADAVPVFRRRLLVLLGLGLAHNFLLWAGDVLHVYALLGLLLPSARRWSNRTLLIIGLLLAVVLPLLLRIILDQAQAHGAEEAAEALEQREAWAGLTGTGSTQRATTPRRPGASTAAASPPASSPRSPGGSCWAWVRVASASCTDRRRIGRCCAGSCAGASRSASPAMDSRWRGKPGCSARTSPRRSASPSRPGIGSAPWRWPRPTSARSCWACSDRASPRWLRPLAPVGRMALTNYLTHSCVFVLVFYRLGLGLVGQVGAAFCLGLAVAVFALQMAVSRWWLRRYRFGPAEWLWRSLTYGRPMPMRGEAADPAAR